jgi:hypothetical protein
VPLEGSSALVAERKRIMRESTRMIAFPGYLKGTREMQNIPRRVDVGVEDGLAESWRSFREAVQAKFCCGLGTETGR